MNLNLKPKIKKKSYRNNKKKHFHRKSTLKSLFKKNYFNQNHVANMAKIALFNTFYTNLLKS